MHKGSPCTAQKAGHTYSLQHRWLASGCRVPLGCCGWCKVAMVIPLGCLYMRNFQCWVASLGLDCSRHRHNCERVSVECVAAHQWRWPRFLTQGVPIGPVLIRKVITMNTSSQGAELWMRCGAHVWPQVLLYAFPPLALIPPTLARLQERGFTVTPLFGRETPASRRYPTPLRPTVASSFKQRPRIAEARGRYFILTQDGWHYGLGHERLNLDAVGLPQNVITTLQNARASSTRVLCDFKWGVLEDWCSRLSVVPFQCSMLHDCWVSARLAW